jgi:uncharacterized damage-inducible protein DinB
LLQQNNCSLLRRYLTIIESISDVQYTLDNQPLFNSSIGAHTRHVLDHYQAFMDGLLLGHVDYDARARVSDIELSRPVAIEKINTTIARLAQIDDDDDRALLVSMDVGMSEVQSNEPQRSTVGRELVFLHGHLIHHEALVVFILRALNISLADNNIGLAPSTIKHKEAL